MAFEQRIAHVFLPCKGCAADSVVSCACSVVVARRVGIDKEGVGLDWVVCNEGVWGVLTGLFAAV